MTTALQRRRGTAAQHTTFTGLAGEITVDTTDNRLVVHDGATAGGHPAAKESELAALAPLASPTFTGVPAAPTAAPGTNTTQISTTAFVKAAIDVVLGGVSAAFDTLAEIATDLGLKMVKTANLSDVASAATAFANIKQAASETATGVSELATVAEGLVGTDTARVTTVAVAKAMIDAQSAAPRRNRLVNPAMQVSQENGNVAGTTDAYYPADEWRVDRVTSAGTITTQRVQSVTPNGSKDRLRVTITAADASLAANEYLRVRAAIEGQEVADLQFGAAAAEQVVVRFGFKGPAGTYAARLDNSAANRSYVALFTISAPNANVDTEQTIVIAGDTSGTWLKDTGIGIALNIVLACGSTFQGATGWQAGNILGTSGVSNGMGTINDVFEIFDVGLYADFESVGVAPAWEIPEYAAEEKRCQRYVERIQNVSAGAFSTTIAIGGVNFKAAKRTTGYSATLVLAGNLVGNGGSTAVTSAPLNNPAVESTAFDFTVAAGLTAAAGYIWRSGVILILNRM